MCKTEDWNNAVCILGCLIVRIGKKTQESNNLSQIKFKPLPKKKLARYHATKETHLILRA